MKVYINTNGCAILRHETYRISKFFSLNGHEEVLSPSDADIAILTGCGVTDNDEKISLEMIVKTKEQLPPSSALVISGCLPRIAKNKILEKVPNIIMIANDEFDKFDALINVRENGGTFINDVVYNNDAETKYYFDSEDIVLDEDMEFAESISTKTGSNAMIRQYLYSSPRRYIWKEPDVYQIRVAYGCGGNCSFCATKLGIGQFRSVNIEKILAQFKEGIKKGFRRFMLIGDEIGFYGTDFNSSLSDLVERIYAISPNIEIGIRYIYPDMLVKNYARLRPFLLSGFIFYFCSAIQTASPRLLKLMGRNPKIEDFFACIDDLNMNHALVKKHTQLIVGFPTETDEDVFCTAECMLKYRFDYININKFSMRNGTKAMALVNDQIDNSVIEERIKFLNKIQSTIRSANFYEILKTDISNSQE